METHQITSLYRAQVKKYYTSSQINNRTYEVKVVDLFHVCQLINEINGNDEETYKSLLEYIKENFSKFKEKLKGLYFKPKDSEGQYIIKSFTEDYFYYIEKFNGYDMIYVGAWMLGELILQKCGLPIKEADSIENEILKD